MIVKFKTKDGWDYRQCGGVATKECLEGESTQESSVNYSMQGQVEILAFLRNGKEVFDVVRYSIAYLLDDNGNTINTL